jgi:Ca2+-binding RTX toxin-like protein
MSYLKVYDRVEAGFDMSGSSDNDTGSFAGDSTLISNIEDQGTWTAKLRVHNDPLIKFSMMSYRLEDENIVFEDLTFYDRNHDRLLDWKEADIRFGADGDIADDLWQTGFRGQDTFVMTKFRDVVKTGDGADTCHGNGGADTLFGERGADRLLGGSGHDDLLGGRGSDTLVGGDGADILTGGRGADTFAFRKVADFATGTALETILDFDRAEDVIDLSRIDADSTTSGDQDFTFIGKARFDGHAGELRCRNGVVAGDLDGDAGADFRIAVGDVQFHESDFIL